MGYAVPSLWGFFGRSIRHKVMIVMTLWFLAFAALGGIAYYYLTQMEFTMHLSGEIDALNNDILDVSRSEKAFFKHQQHDDYDELQENIHRATSRIGNILYLIDANWQLDLERKNKQLLPRLQEKLRDYAAAFEQFALQSTPATQEKDTLLLLGRSIAETTQTLATEVREAQFYMVKSLRTQVMVLVGGILGLVLLTGWRFGRRILGGLQTIEEATQQITHGELVPMRQDSTETETIHVIQAINRMVAELKEQQLSLMQERKMASLGTLTAGVAHQLNNPLNNIYTTCQLSLETLKEMRQGSHMNELLQDCTRSMEIVLQEVRRSRQITLGLLNFARANKLSLQRSNLAEVVSAAMRLTATDRPAGVRVQMHIPPKLYLVLDVQLFQEACINIITNAQQAMSPQGGDIFIKAREEKGHVVLSFSDTGTGMDAAQVKNIFDPFYTTKKMGTGLGLSIAYGIVQQHGGSMVVQSILGEGSTFSIRMPLQQQTSE